MVCALFASAPLIYPASKTPNLSFTPVSPLSSRSSTILCWSRHKVTRKYSIMTSYNTSPPDITMPWRYKSQRGNAWLTTIWHSSSKFNQWNWTHSLLKRQISLYFIPYSSGVLECAQIKFQEQYITAQRVRKTKNTYCNDTRSGAIYGSWLCDMGSMKQRCLHRLLCLRWLYRDNTWDI